jgi:hypothetical protein
MDLVKALFLQFLVQDLANASWAPHCLFPPELCFEVLVFWVQFCFVLRQDLAM